MRGRPRVKVSVSDVERLRQSGYTYRQIALVFGISHGTAHRLGRDLRPSRPSGGTWDTSKLSQKSPTPSQNSALGVL